MSEQRSQSAPLTVTERSYQKDTSDVIVFREVIVSSGDKRYFLRIGTPRFVTAVTIYNSRVRSKEATIDENILQMPTVERISDVADRLNLMDRAIIAPYLEPIEEDQPT